MHTPSTGDGAAVGEQPVSPVYFGLCFKVCSKILLFDVCRRRLDLKIRTRLKQSRTYK